MKKALFLAMFLVVTGLALVSCKQKDNKAPSTSSMLVSGGWKTTKFIRTTSGEEIDITEACDRDNVDTYSTSGVYTHSTGVDNCGGSDANYTDTYKLIDGDKKIVFIDVSDTAQITSISSSKLVLTYAEEGGTTTIEYVK